MATPSTTAYRYEAVDARGKARSGVVDAQSPRQVRDRLRAEGLFPTAIEPAGISAAHGGAVSRTRIAPALVALVTRQLATLVHSGMPLDQALAAVAEQADDATVRKTLASVRAALAEGEPFASALARFPRTFGALYRGLIAAGAETGRLPDVMERLADYLEARQALKQKLTLALIYPALVTVIAIGVIAALMLYVVPQVVGVYEQSRQTLPWLTQALIATSAFVRSTAWLWVALAVAACVAFALAYRVEAVRARIHAAVLRAPAAGRLVAALDTARFASTLAILVASGAPLLRALDAAKDVIWAMPIARAASAAAALVREGVSLARALKEQRIFAPVLVHLVANGEASGRLAAMLERAAAELEREAERRLTWLAALLQPTLIVVMGGIVLVLVLAVMLPIVSMNQLVR